MLTKFKVEGKCSRMFVIINNATQVLIPGVERCICVCVRVYMYVRVYTVYMYCVCIFLCACVCLYIKDELQKAGLVEKC